MATRPRHPPGTSPSNLSNETPPTGAQDDELEPPSERRRRPVRTVFAGQPPQKNSISAIARSQRATAERLANTSRELENRGQADPYALPDGVNARYERSGRNLYLDGELAIIDRGRVLQTPFENKEIIGDVIAIHVERGATDIEVAGSERFRREAWQQATAAGLAVKGYRPPEREAEQPGNLRRQVESESRDAPSREPIGANGIDRPRTPTPRELRENEGNLSELPEPNRTFSSGRLLDHGEAHEQFDARNPLSYFVKLETPAGEVIQWGADLARAVRQSLSGARSGDEVVVRDLGKKPITRGRPIQNERDEVVRQEEVSAWSNQWSVERVDFLRDRARLAAIVRDPSIESPTALRQRPELKGTYDVMDKATEMASRLYADRVDQQRFVTRLRTALADEIQRGEPLSASRSRNRSRESRPNDPRTSRQVQERVLS